MSAAAATKYITEEEYLAIEERSREKHEFYKGEIFAMAGASFAHEDITGNFYRAIGNFLEDKAAVFFLVISEYKFKKIVCLLTRIFPFSVRKLTFMKAGMILQRIQPFWLKYSLLLLKTMIGVINFLYTEI
jgi:hypothetical protein